ncbi:MAG: toluene tolerance protein [Nitrospinaceae bacterium]|nr:MAG: toluene tolerance protein [Nitrospinaceae bacterium]
MKSERSILNLILATVALFVFSAPQAIMAGETQVTKDLKQTIDQVIEIVNDEKLKQDPKARRELLRDTINERFNYNQMAVRALAENWNPRTPEERKEFTEMFQKLLERSYAKKIETFGSGKVDYKDEVIKGKYAMVKTTVEQRGKSVSLDYKLIQENGEWKVYDFVVKGVSVIRNYRNQFSKTLKNQSFSELMKKMEATEEENTI